MTTVLFWDIDGTLLTTGRAGIFALEDATFEVTGKRLDLSTMPTSGLTDVEIACRILEVVSGLTEPESASRLLRLYERYLPSSLPRRAGGVLPNVREILESLKGRPDVASILLTGNTRVGARAKLSHYGLDSYFAHGAFSDSASDRVSIARAALSLARDVVPDLSLDDVYVIGDTPHDIQCGKAIGARVVAVASGTHSMDDLIAHDPWWAVERLPPPDVFGEKLGLGRTRASRERT